MQRLNSDRDLALAVRSILIDALVVLEVPATIDVKPNPPSLLLIDLFGLELPVIKDIELNLPSSVEPFSIVDEKRLLHSLNVWDGDEVAEFRDPAVYLAPDLLQSYKSEDPKRFILPPSCVGGPHLVQLGP